jgi:exosortase/archaeosortase family protein
MSTAGLLQRGSSDDLFGRAARPAFGSGRFLWTALLWELLFFGLLRQAWVERHALGPLAKAQETIAHWYGAPERASIAVTADCSGADVMALCLGVLLAYPVGWRRRLGGMAGALTIILTLNTLRIVTLLVATSPQSIQRLHIVVWPIVIVFALAVYVSWWMRTADQHRESSRWRTSQFAVAASCLLLLYAATAPWTMTSPAVTRAGVWTVASGAALLQSMGLPALGVADVLATPRGSFQVTPECLLTPLLPVSLAVIVAMPWSARRRMLALAFVLPLFFALGVTRLIALALPAAIVTTPLVIVHGFYQLVGGIALIGVAAAARHLGPRVSGGALRWRAGWSFAAGIAGALVTAAVAGGAWTRLVLECAAVLRAVATHTYTTIPPDAFQGALASLSTYHLGLLAGFWVVLTNLRRPGRAVISLCLLAAADVAMLALIGETQTHLNITPHVLVIRAWAIGVPVALAWLLFVTPGAQDDRATYRQFWDGVGRDFPVLTGAPSTDYYFRNEARLLSEQLPRLAGCRLLKSDLWDEAKNTRILQWAAAKGARVFGVDVSPAIVGQARAAFGSIPLGASVADIRWLPFGDDSFDAIYSMGTIEHFAESEAALAEMIRVLRPGGRIVLGVPNRHDPFGRPILVAALSRVGLYAYGFEKSYSRRQLRELLQRAGVEVVVETGILFMPGWLRMLDLAFHSWCRPLAWMTRPAVAACAWLDRHVPLVRRHGYLLASVGVKPERRIHDRR